MAFPSRKETYDSNTPPDLSSRESMNEAQYRTNNRRSSKRTVIQSYRGSISNSSVHTTSTAATNKGLFDCSGPNLGGVPSISHCKSFYSLEKSTFRFGNQSQSTVGTVRSGSVRSSTATSTSKQEIRSLNIPSFEDEDESPLPSTPHSLYNLSTLPEPSPSSSGIRPSTPLDDPSTKPYGDSQPFATMMEIPTADNPPARHPSSLSTPTDRRMGTTSLSLMVPPTNETPSSVSGRATNHKIYETSSPSAPLSRCTPNTTVEYVKPSRQSIKECERLEVSATASKDPFVPSTQAPRPPSSHHTSRLSRSQQKTTPFTSPTPPHPSHTNKVHLADFYAGPNPTTVLGTVPTTPLDGLPGVSFSFTQADSARGDSVTAKGKKATLSIMTDFLNSNKRPEISTPYDPVHLTHVGFNSSTGEFTKEWQQPLQDSGISKFGQEKDSLAVMEVVKFYQEGGGDVWDKMGHAPVRGISLPSPSLIPGAAYPEAPESVNASAEESRNSPNADDVIGSQATVASNGTVAERPAPHQRSAAVASLAKAAGATPRRRKKKKEDKENDPDTVKRLQQICTDADPTRLHRNLVKIGQG